jgi:hypothetical protein
MNQHRIAFSVHESAEGGFTQGETMDELKLNVLDAVRCHFDLETPPEVIFCQPLM